MRRPTATGTGRLARITGSVMTEGVVAGATSGSGAVSRVPRRATSVSSRVHSPSQAAPPSASSATLSSRPRFGSKVLAAPIGLSGDAATASATAITVPTTADRSSGPARAIARSRLGSPSAAHTAFSSDRRVISRPSAWVRVTSPASAATAANATRPRAATRAADDTSSRSVANVTLSSAVCPAPGSP